MKRIGPSRREIRAVRTRALKANILHAAKCGTMFEPQERYSSGNRRSWEGLASWDPSIVRSALKKAIKDGWIVYEPLHPDKAHPSCMGFYRPTAYSEVRFADMNAQQP